MGRHEEPLDPERVPLGTHVTIAFPTASAVMLFPIDERIQAVRQNLPLSASRVPSPSTGYLSTVGRSPIGSRCVDTLRHSSRHSVSYGVLSKFLIELRLLIDRDGDIPGIPPDKSHSSRFSQQTTLSTRLPLEESHQHVIY